MANYFVINNKFKPYSFDELIKPYQIYGQAYKEQEEAYNTLQSDSGKLSSFINENNAPKSWEAYNNFSQALREQANNLSVYGLSPESKKALNILKQDYNTKVEPIATAVNRRQKAIEDFSKTPEGKSNRYIGQTPSDTSVDDWLNGNTPSIIGVDGKTISDYVKEEVANASDRHYREYTKAGYRITKVGTNQVETSQLLHALKTGTRFDDSTEQGRYMNAVLDDISNNVVKGALETFGYSNYLQPDENGDLPETLQPNTLEAKRYLDEIYDGIYRGMKGSEKKEVDQYALEATRFAHNKELERIKHQHALDEAAAKNGGANNPTLDQYRSFPFLTKGKNFDLNGAVRNLSTPIEYTTSDGRKVTISNPIDATLVLRDIKDYKTSIADSLAQYGITEKVLANFAKNDYAQTQRVKSADGKTEIEISRDNDGNLSVTTRRIPGKFERPGEYDDGTRIVVPEGSGPVTRAFGKIEEAGRQYFGTGRPFTQDADLTKQFNAAINKYREANATENHMIDAGIKDAALSKKETKRLLDTLGLPEGTELDSEAFAKAVQNIPQSRIEQRAFIHLTVPGDDGKGNRGAITGELEQRIYSRGDQRNVAKAPGTESVHKIDIDTGEPEDNPIRYWTEAFKFDDKTGEITNIINYDLYPPAVARGNVVVTTDKGSFEVPAMFLGSPAYNAIYGSNVGTDGSPLPSYKDAIGYMIDKDYSLAEENLYSLAAVLANGYGYNFFQRQGPTEKIK